MLAAEAPTPPLPQLLSLLPLHPPLPQGSEVPLHPASRRTCIQVAAEPSVEIPKQSPAAGAIIADSLVCNPPSDKFWRGQLRNYFINVRYTLGRALRKPKAICRGLATKYPHLHYEQVNVISFLNDVDKS